MAHTEQGINVKDVNVYLSFTGFAYGQKRVWKD